MDILKMIYNYCIDHYKNNDKHKYIKLYEYYNKTNDKNIYNNLIELVTTSIIINKIYNQVTESTN